MSDVWADIRSAAETVGAGIRAERVRRGMFLDDAAALVGCDAPTLSRIEQGKAVPSLRVSLLLSDHRLQSCQSVATAVPAIATHIVTPTPARATHPVTSRTAALSVNRDRARAVHLWIIDTLASCRDGLTHEQLWRGFESPYTCPDRSVRSSQSGLRTRVSELVRGGVVRDSGRTRTMTTGRQGIVWTLTEQDNHDH